MLRRPTFWLVTLVMCVVMILFRVKDEVSALEIHNGRIKKEIRENKRKQLVAKELFNGKIVSEVLGVTRSDITKAVTELKAKHPATLGSIEWLSQGCITVDDVKEIILGDVKQ